MAGRAKYGYDTGDDVIVAQLAAFKAKWRWYAERGDVDTMRAVSGRKSLIDMVWWDVRRALRKPDTEPYRGIGAAWKPIGERKCDPDLGKTPEQIVTDEEVEAWVDIDWCGRAGLAQKVQRALTFIDRFRSCRLVERTPMRELTKGRWP